MANKKDSPRKTNSLAIISLILAVASFVLGIIPFLNLVSSPLAVIFGFLALGKIKKDKTHGRWMAVVGIILGLINLLISGIILGGLYYITTQ